MPVVNLSAAVQGSSLITLPAHAGVSGEEDQKVFCADAFRAVVETAAGNFEVLSSTTRALVAAHMAEGRPQRTRTQCVLYGDEGLTAVPCRVRRPPIVNGRKKNTTLPLYTISVR